MNLLDPKHSQEVQLAAVRAISGFSQPEIAASLLARWRNAVPVIRSEIVLAMLSGRNRMLPLLRPFKMTRSPHAGRPDRERNRRQHYTEIRRWPHRDHFAPE